MSEKRLDQILLELFPQWTRSQIQKLIQSGDIEFSEDQISWYPLTKPGQKFDFEKVHPNQFRIRDTGFLKYVSQGALKLEKALDTFEVDVRGKTALDVGLSTGGFSDLLLHRGVQKVLGIDVGQGQLHKDLQSNDKLMAFEKINARYPLPEAILQSFFGEQDQSFDLIVVDVSFISLSLLIPNLLDYLKKGGTLIVLVKPQFELSKKDLNKKGVVKDQESRNLALEKILGVFRQNALEQMEYCDSPIEGDNGNKEFLLKGSKV